MYDKDFKVSTKRANATKAFVEAAINTYENTNKQAEAPKYRTKFQEDANMVLEHTMHRETVLNRYRSFVETVKSSLVVECMYKIFENAVEPNKRDLTNTAIMRAMVSQYVKENGYDNILNRMRTGSVALSEMHNIITDSASKIIECVDKNDPNTFTVSPEMKDEFFKSLDYSDSQAISDAIKDRVSTAMDDFVTANTKDHEDIETALQDAEKKIEATPEDNKELREAYEIQAKRKTSAIRNTPKNVLHSMISAMCESVLKHQDEYAEFMNEGRLDIGKIVDRTSLMYTFMEMLNTSRLDKVDEAFIESAINDLKK